MSDITILKTQLYSLADGARQGAGSLAGFKQRFGQQSAEVQKLIAGSATNVDRDIAELLDAASKSVDEAAQALTVAAAGCKSYADQI